MCECGMAEAEVLAGAPEHEIEITPEMIEAGLVELYAWDRDDGGGRIVIERILKAALANYFRPHHATPNW